MSPNTNKTCVLKTAVKAVKRALRR